MKRFKITRYNVTLPRLPKELTGKKAILLSDLHNAELGAYDNNILVNRIKEEKPDFILISGDVITCRLSSDLKYIYKLLEALSKLGVEIYYAPGNHEHKMEEQLSYEEAVQFENTVGKYCTYLKNSSVNLSVNGKTVGGVEIYGLDLPYNCYHPGNKRLKEPEPAVLDGPLPQFDKNKFTVMIAHDPQYFEAYVKMGAGLVVSGHLHGGIIRLPLLGGIISPRYKLFPKYDLGIYRKENTQMIVTSGLGWHHIPIRLFNPPEIVLITF